MRGRCYLRIWVGSRRWVLDSTIYRVILLVDSHLAIQNRVLDTNIKEL